MANEMKSNQKISIFWNLINPPYSTVIKLFSYHISFYTRMDYLPKSDTPYMGELQNVIRVLIGNSTTLTLY